MVVLFIRGWVVLFLGDGLSLDLGDLFGEGVVFL